MAPLQDTPSVKATYGACITVENSVHAYMSANVTSSFIVETAPTFNTTCFQLNLPIPSYLIAVAIGDIAYQYIGGRCAILTEPGFMSQAVYEFSNLN
jgi:aminopeptidase N